MKTRTKRGICVAIGWFALLLTLGIVGGVERGTMSVASLLWMIPTTATFAFTMYKAGWLQCQKNLEA